ncbi:hypothetical protein M427DRAFT_56372 [Gonapodya prolifera JEL478]|uniref:Uncharacterized protein n=1 Tax=Gonapodya prolifera (strain JEL478) TaxID=1344416 RepID=A0A139AHB6_GONPJ|nr:hypothetical protein M427DRAFT_56372 [Gonapodya prolifera JEL478]|eukprot:KXS15803.1 hypothetical protein M427DRAFT_56372 [Gonapodya prolifera JEL478]
MEIVQYMHSILIHTLSPSSHRIGHPSGRSVDQLVSSQASLFCDTIPLSAVLRREIGPLIPSVTTSLSLQFYKPFPPDTFDRMDACWGGGWVPETGEDGFGCGDQGVLRAGCGDKWPISRLEHGQAKKKAKL